MIEAAARGAGISCPVSSTLNRGIASSRASRARAAARERETARRRAADVVRDFEPALARGGVFLADAVRVVLVFGVAAVDFAAALVVARRVLDFARVAGSADVAATSMASTAANALVSARRIR